MSDDPIDAAAALRYFVANSDGEPAALARVHGHAAAERFVAGGSEWEHYPRLVRLVVDSLQMEWDEITRAEADEIQRKLAASKPLS